MPSPVARRLIGTYVVDSLRPITSLAAWTQEECRNGSLRDLVDSFTAEQPEPLDASLLLVEKVESDGILARIPCKMFDHESPHSFLSEVWLKVNPLTKTAQRQDA
jgi:hypothetical protein